MGGVIQLSSPIWALQFWGWKGKGRRVYRRCPERRRYVGGGLPRFFLSVNKKAEKFVTGQLSSEKIQQFCTNNRRHFNGIITLNRNIVKFLPSISFYIFFCHFTGRLNYSLTNSNKTDIFSDKLSHASMLGLAKIKPTTHMEQTLCRPTVHNL